MVKKTDYRSRRHYQEPIAYKFVSASKRRLDQHHITDAKERLGVKRKVGRSRSNLSMGGASKTRKVSMINSNT
jgi:hypothetical protein